MAKLLTTLLCSLALLAQGLFAQRLFAQAQPPLTVYSRVPESELDQRNSFEYALITLLLSVTESSHGPFRLLPLPPMTAARSLHAVANHQLPNLVTKQSYSTQLADHPALQVLLPPVEFGTVGYRVCFVSPAMQHRVKHLRTAADLAQLRIGQGIGWLDTDILRANGLQVTETAQFSSLFSMLMANRIDLFCRGVNEWQAEMTEHQQRMALILDPHLLLHYPLPRVLVTHKRNRALIERLQAGLNRVSQNGELAALWRKHYGASVIASNLQRRHTIPLINPLSPPLPSTYQQFMLSPAQLLDLAKPETGKH